MEAGDFVFAVSDGMGGAKAGEVASKIATDKITKLLPAQLHGTGGFSTWIRDSPTCSSELFSSRPTSRDGQAGAALRGMPRHGRHPQPVLVHARLDVLRPRRRQPHLLPACRTDRDEPGDPRPQPRRLAAAPGQAQRAPGPQPPDAQLALEGPRRRTSKGSTPRSGGSIAPPATAFSSARTAWSTVCGTAASARCWPANWMPG
jgi:hypothetical protein